MLITYKATLLQKKLVAPHIYHLRFSFPTEPGWTFKAGQYMILHVPQPEGRAVRRLYSIASPPSLTDSLDFLIEMVPNGVGSMYVESLKEGDEVTWQGPAGLFVYKSTTRTPIFLATGTGIAPIFSMAYDQLMAQPETATPYYLFWGLKTCEDMYFTKEISELVQKHPSFVFKTCLSRITDMSQVPEEAAAHSLMGRVTTGVEQLVSTSNLPITSFDYYLCGSKHVVEALREYLAEKQVPTDQVFFEKFT